MLFFYQKIFKISLFIAFLNGMIFIFFMGLFGYWDLRIIGLVMLSYFIIQNFFAINNTYLYRMIINDDYEPYQYPSICFNIIGYRENPEYWKECLLSIKKTNYPRINGIFAFVDGNDEQDVYMKEIFDTIYNDDNGYIAQSKLLEHGGKRSAMFQGFLHIKNVFPDNEYIIVIDSDTIIKDPCSVTYLVKGIHSNALNGCGTGSLKIFNRSSLITKIVHARYGYAFDIERGAMSYFGCMNCCSGPFSIYRQKLLTMELLERFNNQYYCKWKVEPGDDRHLTNLIMNTGYRSIQVPFAIAYTESPESFYRFLTQQLRWMRSFYREQVWQVRSIPLQNIYLIWVTVYEMLFPFFIITAFIYHYFQDVAFLLLVRRIIISFLIIIIRTIFLLWFNNFDKSYLYNVYYFPFYFIFLLPIKLYSIFTCYRMQWITSGRKNKLTSLFGEKVMISIFVVLWNCFLVFSFVHFYRLNNSLDNILKFSI